MRLKIIDKTTDRFNIYITCICMSTSVKRGAGERENGRRKKNNTVITIII